MAEDPNGGEKTEMPTPKRLQDARNDGQVAFSSEANIAGLLIIGFATLAVMGPSFCQAMGNIITRCLGDALTWDLEGGGLRRLIVTMCAPAFAWLLPFLGVLFAAGLGLCIAQVGFHVSGKALVPKLNRVSPFTGFQRLFGYRGLMRVLLSALKLTAVILVSWHVLQVDIPGMVPISLDLAARMGHESHTLFTFGMKVACVLALIAAGDFIFQRWQHTRDMMMTKQEVKEEYKQSEGDPLVKSKIRQIQRQMAQRRMMQEVPKADVVITNPTHVAVALEIRQGEHGGAGGGGEGLRRGGAAHQGVGGEAQHRDGGERGAGAGAGEGGGYREGDSDEVVSVGGGGAEHGLQGEEGEEVDLTYRGLETI